MIPGDVLDIILAPLKKALSKPPKPRGLLVFARTLRVKVHNDDTGLDEWITFDPESHPAQMEILKAFHAGFPELVVMGPVQDGKSTAVIVITLLYCLIELRQNAMLMMPAQNQATRFWEEKVLPVIEKSGYTWILPSSRGSGRGSKDGIADMMLLETGALIFLVGAGGESESAQASFTVRYAFLDEASKVRPKFIELAQQRAASYNEFGRFVRTSTLRDPQEQGAENDLTWVGLQDSSCGRLHFQCPLCKIIDPNSGWQNLHHSRVIFDRADDAAAAASVRVRCLYDDRHLLTDAQRKIMIRSGYKLVYRGQHIDHGQVVGERPPSSRSGLIWTCWDSPLKSLAKIAVKWRQGEHQLKAAKDHSALKILWHEYFVEPYTAEHASKPGEVTNLTLAEKSASSTLNKRTLPSWTDHCVLVVDVQKRQHYWELLAFGAGDQCAIVDWGYETLVPQGFIYEEYEPTPNDRQRVCHLIDDMVKRGWQVAGRPLEADLMSPALYGMDVGYAQDFLLTWMAPTKWIAIKGAGQRDESGKIQVINGDDIEVPESMQGLMRITIPKGWSTHCWWSIGDVIRHRIHDGLMRVPGPGCIQIPRGLKSNDVLLLHLSAVIWTVDDKTGKGYWREKVHPRWDYLDLAIYGWMLGRYYSSRIELAAAIALHQEHKRSQAALRPSPQTQPNREHSVRRRSSVMHRRRHT